MGTAKNFRGSVAGCSWGGHWRCASVHLKLYCGAKLPKDVAKHLNTKLHKDNCRRKGMQDVPDEVPLNVDDQVAPASLLVDRTQPRSSDIEPSRLLFAEDPESDTM
jgi:hypothetical protein